MSVEDPREELAICEASWDELRWYCDALPNALLEEARASMGDSGP